MSSVHPALHAAPALLALLAPFAQASDRIDLLVDTAGPGGALLELAETTGTPAPASAKLRGLRFLPLDYQGRTQLDALRPDRPRFRDDLPGASRVELPGGGGFLYRHARELADGSTLFGFLRVLPDGYFSLHAERPGLGPAGDQDPWLSRVSISADGQRLLAATRLPAGGNVLELDLAAGTELDRSANVPPLPWLEGGLAFGEGFGVAISSRGVFRFDLGPGGHVQRVPLSQPAPSWHSGEVALSANGAWAITTAGDSQLLAHAWVFSASGPGRRATTAPGHLTGAGYLPDALGGPHLAVADDGSTAAWRAIQGAGTIDESREAFLGKVEAPPGQDPVQVTADGYFIDTLDEVDILTSAGPGTIILAVGEKGTDPAIAIENADFFRVSLDAGGNPQFVNVTRTSGDLTPPFDLPGDLALSHVHALPEAGGYLAHTEMSGGTGALILVDPDQTGFQTVLPDVKALDFAVGMGDQLALSVQRRFASNDPHQVLRVPRDLSQPPVIVDQVLLDVQYLYPVTTGDGWLAFLARVDLGPEMVQRVHIQNGGLETFPSGSGDYGEVLGLSPAGALLLSWQTGTGDALFYTWPFDGSLPRLLNAPLAPGHIVPGR